MFFYKNSMLQEFIKEQNDHDDLFINPKYNNNLEFLTNYIKIELEYFNFSKMSADILTDICIWSNDIPSGYASNSPICQDRAIKQKALLSEKYKDCNMYVLRPKVDKKVSYYNEKRRELYTSHFLSEKWIDNNKITKMINLCIQNNIEIKGINLVKFRSLRNSINSCIAAIQTIPISSFEEIKT
jgi:hypothetical protein